MGGFRQNSSASRLPIDLGMTLGGDSLPFFYMLPPTPDKTFYIGVRARHNIGSTSLPPMRLVSAIPQSSRR